MSKRYITSNTDGTISVTQFTISGGGRIPDTVRMAKSLFELSRTTDLETHFDASVHTLEAIDAGLEGHRPLAFLDEVEDTDLPSDRYFRNAWEWED